MSKIICDVCGTTYPDTAQQCPICGSARPEAAQNAPSAEPGAGAQEAAGYNYVRGGRFSKSNVKKRNRAVPAKPQAAPVEKQPEKQGKKKENPRSNRGLIILALILLLAIVAVAVFIYVRFFHQPEQKGNIPTLPTTQQTEPTGRVTDPTTTDPAQAEVPCTGLTLRDSRIDLDAAGRAWLLEVKTVPANSTEPVTFASSDTRVATVTDAGRVEAVGPGQATITITCGSQTVECRVVCTFPEDTTTEPSETTEDPDETEEATEAPVSGTLTLSHSDATLFSAGESFRISAGSISSVQINWSSNNPAVATVSNGTVTAVGPGMTTINAEYNGQKATCIVRCSFDDPNATEAPTQAPTEAPTEAPTQAPTDAPTEAPTEAPTQAPSNSVSISHSDVTIAIGESFTLSLRDGSGNAVNVSWGTGDSAVCIVSGSTVTGTGAGTTTVSGTYEGKTYSCIVRVSG